MTNSWLSVQFWYIFLFCSFTLENFYYERRKEKKNEMKTNACCVPAPVTNTMENWRGKTRYMHLGVWDFQNRDRTLSNITADNEANVRPLHERIGWISPTVDGNCSPLSAFHCFRSLIFRLVCREFCHDVEWIFCTLGWAVDGYSMKYGRVVPIDRF